MSDDSIEEKLRNEGEKVREETAALLARNADLIAGDSAKFLQQISEENKARNQPSGKVVHVNFGRKLLALAAALVAAAVAWFVFFSSPRPTNEFDYQLAARGDGTIERGFGATLPKTLSVKFSKQSIAVATDQESLNGTMQFILTETTPDEAVYRVDLSGTDKEGKRGEFKGRMRVVRASPNAPVEKKENIQRIILDGDFKVGAQPALPTSRAYYP